MSTLVGHILDKSGNSVDHYQNFLHSNQPGVRQFRYLTLQLETKEIESIGLYEDYHWKVSLWNTKSSRISRDLFLKADNFNDVHVFELPALNAKDQSSHTYIYVDLVHRLSGIPIASGSQVVVLPENKDSKGDAYTVRKVSAQLPLCEHIKYWPTHESVEYIHSNGTRCVVLNASIGTLTTTGRIDSITNSYSIGSATQLVQFTTVPSFQPSLLDRLRATAAPLLSSYKPPCVWYLTVEDLQLTSDILDLYVDRHILVSAGCGGAASLAPHSYLGHILRYEGHYIERAEIAISAVQDDLSQYQYERHHGDVYKSCMNFEVKVVECASGRDTMSAGDEAPIDRCVLCVGVLQLAQKVPHNDPLASDAADGSILDPEELTSGTYEVLLYTVYNPDAEIDVTLVGKAVVKLHVPDSAFPTVSPVVSVDAPAAFQLQRFDDPNRTSAEAFLYWAQCLVSCCANLQQLGREPENSVREGRSAERHKEALKTELKALLQVLGRPEYTESVIHAEIVRYLVHCGADAFHSVVLPALHAYFQEWLLSEELSALMLPSTAADGPSESASPSKATFGPASSQPSPVPTATIGAESPGKSRPKSPFSSTKFSISSPLENIRDVDWESVRGSCACIKFLSQVHALFSTDFHANDDHSTSLSSVGPAHQESEVVDHASLCEISEDLLRATLTYATKLLRVWVEWSAQCPIGCISKDAWKHLGPDCLRRVRKAFTVMCLLISNVTTMVEGTQLAIQTFTATLLDFTRVIARLPGQHDLALKDWYESWMEATFRELSTILLTLLQVVMVYTFPQNNPAAALPSCLDAICACADVCSDNSAWLLQALNSDLHVALAGVISVMSRRLFERITHFAEEGDEDDVPVLGLPISLWSLRDTTEKKEIPVEPTVDPPLSARKLNRRSSAVNMFGADVTTEPGTPLQSQAQSQSQSQAVQPQATLPSVSFGPSATTGPIVDEETRTRNLLAADSHSEEAVLHFLHGNKSYVCALRRALTVLLQVQPRSKPSSKGKSADAPVDRQTSVGVLSGFHALHEVCDRLMNGLCKGMVTKPEALKALIRSSADSNGLSGQGMLIFVELTGWLHGALFNFIRDNQPLQIKMDVTTAQALAERSELLVLYHMVFCDMLRDNARADRYLNRTVWLAHQGSTDANSGSSLFAPPTPSAAGAVSFNFPDVTAPPPPLSPQFRGAPSPSVATAVLGIASNRAKRFEEFSAAGSVAVARWIAIRRTLQDALYAICECTVAITRAIDFSDTEAQSEQRLIASALCIPFGKCVALFCRNVLMLDLGTDSRDIVTALVAETPLHIPMQQLYRLAESVPASLLPERAAASPEDNLENSLMLLISTIFDVVKLHTELKTDPYPAALDSATCALAQLLEDITLKSIQTTKDGTMFHLKNILKTPLNSYLLVEEDPAWSAQPIIVMKTVGDAKKTTKNEPLPARPFRRMMIDFLRSFNADWKLQPSLAFLQREFSLHMTSSKLLICARHALANEDPLLLHSPAQYPLLRSMFEKTLLGSALSNTLIFGLRFMRSSGDAVQACQPLSDTNDNLLFVVGQLAEIFRSKPDASTAKAGQNSSELLSVFGCSFKAYHDLLHLIIHRQQYSGELTVPTASASPALTTSEVSRRLELEIYQLRHCLQGLLRSGQWEVGVEVAQLYLEKYKIVSALPFVPPPPPPPPPQPLSAPARTPATPSSASPLTLPPMSPTKSLISIGSSKNQVGTPQRAPFSPVAQQQSFTFDDHRGLSSAASSPVPTTNPTASIAKRIDAIKAELARVLDTLDSRIKSNGDLRLFPHFYALRFVSDTPWEASTQDETIMRALGHIREEGYQCTSAWMHVSATTGDGQPAPAGQLRQSSVYEYWLLMKFDASSFPVCADFYDDILALDEQRVQDAQRGVLGSDRSGSGFSLVSPIAYHNIQAQLAMAYPAYTMVSSHHMMESYFSENSFDTQRAGYVKFMQLFQAFPAEICDEAQQPAVLDALQAIQEAKTAKLTVTAEQATVCDDIDGLDLTRGSMGPDGEAKAAESVTHSQVNEAEDSDFVTQLKKHLFTDSTPTRFFAYSFMNTDQIDAMDEEYKARGDDLPESSAYIQRFELAVSDSRVDFAHLRTPLESELPPVRPTNSSLSAPALGQGLLPSGVRGRYSRPGTEAGSVDGGAGATGAGAGNAATAAGVSDLKALGVFDVSPVNLAVHRASTRCTPIDVSLETMYYVSVQLRRALEALKKLNEFSKTEVANEPVGDVISSDSIFAGVFTLLSNLLSMPNCNCLGFNNLETILVSEQERIDVEWQEERKGRKQAYNKALEEYEESKQLESKKWKKYMKEKPAEPDFPALEAAFYAQPRHAHLRSVKTLHDEAQLLLWKTIKEMRKFVAAKEDKEPGTVHALSTEELRNIAIKKGRRPTVTSMVLRSNLAVHLAQMPDTMDAQGGPPVEPADTEKSLKMKLCLFVESLFAAMEVGIPI